MAGKEERLALIERVVRGGRIHTQRALIGALRARGHRPDQSTLSRDLAELGIRKVGGRYVREEAGAAAAHAPGPGDLASVVARWTTCGPHLTVIDTVVGQAQAVAVAIDLAADPAIAATLAGDDTVFLATKHRRLQVVALRRLKQWFGDKHEP